MTDEQINQCIAEACGWTDFVVHPEFGLMGTPPDTHGLRTAVDWYTFDLNSMREAETELLRRHGAWEIYRNKLVCMFGCDAFAASARNRAEAFLRTLGKWDQSGDATEMEAQK